MLEQEFHISGLIAGHLNGELDPVQEKELQAWLAASAENRQLLIALSNENLVNGKIKDYHNVDSAALWSRALDRVQDKEVKVKRIKLRPRIAVAAAAVAAIVFGIWFHNARHLEGSQGTRDLLNYANDIAPGKNTATLTLSNGKTITLSDAKNGVVVGDDKLSYNDGSSLLQNDRYPEGEERSMTLSTPRGGTYQITLSDGTKVWLNAASSLTYSPRQSKYGKRSVELEGEAYFEVAKDKKHPFVVESSGQKVEVLGTHFNVNAYRDENTTKTTLLEGKVRVLAGGAEHILRPGEQARNNGQSIKVQKVNTENITDWKENDFVFNGDDFKTAMRKIERWYNVEIVYEEGIGNDVEIGGWISRKNNISSVLKLIESTKQVKFKIDGRRVFVYK